jgi:hypothetical protein
MSKAIWNVELNQILSDIQKIFNRKKVGITDNGVRAELAEELTGVLRRWFERVAEKEITGDRRTRYSVTVWISIHETTTETPLSFHLVADNPQVMVIDVHGEFYHVVSLGGCI